MKERGITVVSPMWGERSITDRMVGSVIHQFIGKDHPFNIHLVLVDDYIEGRIDGPSPYEYYISEEFAKTYDSDHIKISLLQNEGHEYQGYSREIGFLAGDYDYFVMIDCDDMLAPNACERYLHIIDEASKPEDSKPLACIYGMVYSFDEGGYENNINGDSIWVQGRCYNRDFIKKHDIHFLRGLHSRQGEDYPFIRKFDYALAHDEEYQAVRIPYNENHDCQATAFWFPNHDSLSRKDPHYGQHLSGWTMASSNSILDFFEEFNKKNGFEDQEDEYMKHECLNMTIYSFYNLLDFIREISMTDYKPLEEDWYVLRDNVARLRDRLKDKYWDEIVYSDTEDMLFHVRHHSDCRFVESWIGTFYDYMAERHPIFDMTYDDLMEYAKSLEFDGALHEIHTSYVKAWAARHPKKEGVKDEGTVTE